MNTAALVASFATGSYSVARRTNASTATYGVIDDGTASTITITASVSPARGADLLKVPEGRRTDETRTIFTTTRLYVGDPADGYDADQITIAGVVYELVHLETWFDTRGGATAYKAIAVRM